MLLARTKQSHHSKLMIQAFFCAALISRFSQTQCKVVILRSARMNEREVSGQAGRHYTEAAGRHNTSRLTSSAVGYGGGYCAARTNTCQGLQVRTHVKDRLNCAVRDDQGGAHTSCAGRAL